MKLEVGMYVRTKSGLIAKYIDIDDIKYLFDKNIYWYYEYYNDYVYKEDFKEWFEEEVVKTSYTIIDLIEVGDIIRYRIDKVSLATKGYLTGVVDITDEEMLESIKEDKNYHVLQILTKEQFEQEAYKVGE